MSLFSCKIPRVSASNGLNILHRHELSVYLLLLASERSPPESLQLPPDVRCHLHTPPTVRSSNQAGIEQP